MFLVIFHVQKREKNTPSREFLFLFLHLFYPFLFFFFLEQTFEQKLLRTETRNAPFSGKRRMICKKRVTTHS